MNRMVRGFARGLAVCLAVSMVMTACSGNEEKKAAEPKQVLTSMGNPIDTETLRNKTGKTLIKMLGDLKYSHTTVGIVSSKGTVAIADPYEMSQEKGIIKADIITVSHDHYDHFDPKYLDHYKNGELKAKLSWQQVEQFTVKDMTVTGIESSHSTLILPSNYIYLYEVDGIRIAHFGDMHQDELSPEQLKQLGTVDILFTPFNEDNDGTQEKTLKAVEQVKPKIVVPLHCSLPVIDYVLKQLNITDRTEATELAVNREDLDRIQGMKYIFLK